MLKIRIMHAFQKRLPDREKPEKGVSFTPLFDSSILWLEVLPRQLLPRSSFADITTAIMLIHSYQLFFLLFEKFCLKICAVISTTARPSKVCFVEYLFISQDSLVFSQQDPWMGYLNPRTMFTISQLPCPRTYVYLNSRKTKRLVH